MKKDKGLVRIEAVFFFLESFTEFTALVVFLLLKVQIVCTFILFIFYVVISMNNPCSGVRMFRISSAVFSQTLKRK